MLYRIALVASLVLIPAGFASAAGFDIRTVTGAVAPSFRGEANTTWFGWSAGSFDGATDDGKIDSPAPTVGTTTVGVNLTQTDPAATLLSSTNNIYTGSGYPLSIEITAPTAGTPAAGFTTIIVQGRTAFGAFGGSFAVGDVGGDTADFVVGTNAASAGQFFAKYEIAGNASSYVIPIFAGPTDHISLNNLQVDTYWSATGYAADFAVVPEPASLTALAAAGLAIVRRRPA